VRPMSPDQNSPIGIRKSAFRGCAEGSGMKSTSAE
jgi:hypothetical protein